MKKLSIILVVCLLVSALCSCASGEKTAVYPEDGCLDFDIKNAPKNIDKVISQSPYKDSETPSLSKHQEETSSGVKATPNRHIECDFRACDNNHLEFLDFTIRGNDTRDAEYMKAYIYAALHLYFPNDAERIYDELNISTFSTEKNIDYKTHSADFFVELYIDGTNADFIICPASMLSDSTDDNTEAASAGNLAPDAKTVIADIDIGIQTAGGYYLEVPSLLNSAEFDESDYHYYVFPTTHIDGCFSANDVGGLINVLLNLHLGEQTPEEEIYFEAYACAAIRECCSDAEKMIDELGIYDFAPEDVSAASSTCGGCSAKFFRAGNELTFFLQAAQ